MNQSIDHFAKTLWNYNLLHQTIEMADCILVLGSHDKRVAEKGAQTLLDGFAPVIVFSGKTGRNTEDWSEDEAEVFAQVAKEIGVPEDKILLEENSTNTGDNISFSLKLLHDNGINFDSVILVTKPYMERRAFATFLKIAPEIKVIVTSSEISYEDYPNREISKEEMINTIVGDVQRIKEYPAQGFMVEQEIPNEVWTAWEELVKLGFNKQLLFQ